MSLECIEASALFKMFGREVDRLGGIVEDARSHTLGMTYDDAAVLNTVCNHVDSFRHTFLEMHDRYNVERDSELEELREKVADLQYNLELYKSFTKAYTDENKRLKERLANQMEVVDRAASLMDLIESRINVVANSVAITKRMKDHRLSGEESPRYLHNIDTDELVALYKAAGFKLTDDVLTHFQKACPGVSYVTLRDRLVKAGVWRGRQSKTAD